MLVVEFPFFPVDIAQTDKPSSPFQSFAQQSCICQTVFHDLSIPIEPKADQIIVLANYLCSRPGEVQRISLLSAPEVIKLEDELFWQIGAVSPDYPTQSRIHEAVLMSGCID